MLNSLQRRYRMQFGSKTDLELVDKQTAQQKEYHFSQCIDYIKKKLQRGRPCYNSWLRRCL